MGDLTVRGMVRQIQIEVRDSGDLQPDRAAELLVMLSALQGNCLDAIRDADIAYNEVLLQFLDSDEAANRAKIRAETSPQYRTKRECHDTLTLAQELSRSLKYFLKQKQDEYFAARHQ